MSRGRVAFRAYRPAFVVGGLVLRALPSALCVVLLTAFRNFPGRVGMGLRFMLVSRLAKRCGNCVAVFEGVFFRNIQLLELGSNISIHPMCYIDAAGSIEIGNDVSIAHASSLVSHNHDYSSTDSAIREAPPILSKITIGSDVWIGCGVRILAGVAIGDRTVIGAGAVVTRGIPHGSVAVGVPARPINVAHKAA